MKVTFSYFAQIRQKAGVESEPVEVPDGSTALEALKTIDHGGEFQSLLFNDSGALHPVILLIMNEGGMAPDTVLKDGDQVQVFSPVAGG
jgi:molybdopterin converting factor small subunit